MSAGNLQCNVAVRITYIMYFIYTCAALFVMCHHNSQLTQLEEEELKVQEIFLERSMHDPTTRDRLPIVAHSFTHKKKVSEFHTVRESRLVNTLISGDHSALLTWKSFSFMTKTSALIQW